MTFFLTNAHSFIFCTHIKDIWKEDTLMYRVLNFSIICFCLLLLVACGGGGGGNASGNESDYDQTKKMVVDILKTDDGKKALVETLSDEKLKQELVINSEEVQKAINETLVSDEGKKM